MQRQIVSSWSNFVKVGDPTPPGSDHSWLAVDKKIESGDQQWYFNISGLHSAMDGSPQILNRLKFWDQLFEQ